MTDTHEIPAGSPDHALPARRADQADGGSKAPKGNSGRRSSGPNPAEVASSAGTLTPEARFATLKQCAELGLTIVETAAHMRVPDTYVYGASKLLGLPFRHAKRGRPKHGMASRFATDYEGEDLP